MLGVFCSANSAGFFCWFFLRLKTRDYNSRLLESMRESWIFEYSGILLHALCLLGCFFLFLLNTLKADSSKHFKETMHHLTFVFVCLCGLNLVDLI